MVENDYLKMVELVVIVLICVCQMAEMAEMAVHNMVLLVGSSDVVPGLKIGEIDVCKLKRVMRHNYVSLLLIIVDYLFLTYYILNISLWNDKCYFIGNIVHQVIITLIS